MSTDLLAVRLQIVALRESVGGAHTSKQQSSTIVDSTMRHVLEHLYQASKAMGRIQRQNSSTTQKYDQFFVTVRK